MKTKNGSSTSGTSMNLSMDCKKMDTARARRIVALKKAPRISQRFRAKVKPGL
jgi:hypothetical protein